MITSMTAFSRAELSSGSLTVSLEIKGYNSRYLDISIKVPPIYSPLEDRIRKVISERISRGRIELKASIQEETENACTFALNETMAKAYYDTLVKLKNCINCDIEIPMALVAQRNGVIESSELTVDTEKIWPPVNECLMTALKDFDAMKTNEGKAIEADLNQRLSFIAASLSTIEAHTPDMLPIYQEKLKERIKSLTNGMVEIDPARIAQEAAFLADRSDISEEIVRAKSHLTQFRNLTESPQPSGRPLNFLLQELNREFNTMGSKAGNAEISHLIVSVKTELEKIREQIQNVE